jgi:hypothetical protein
LTPLAIYCATCLRFIEHGREAGPCGGLKWIEMCAWCSGREQKRQEEVARLEAMWQVRECAAPGCSTTFVPATTRQVHCSSRCRARAWRARRATVRSMTGP